MASKRDFSEFDGPTHAGDQGGRSFTRHRQEWAAPTEDRPYKKQKNKKHAAKEGTSNWTKKRARTIERRLARDTSKLPADVQRDLERELASLQKRLAEDKTKRHRSKMIQKYHMVRFFERQKAKRLEKQLKTKLDAATDAAEIERLKADLHIATVDVKYAQYFPHMERYISLYPSAAASGEAKQSDPDKKKDRQATAEAALRMERPPLWPAVEAAMAKGQHALEQLRDRKLDVDLQLNTPSKHDFKANAKKAKAEKGKPADGQQRPNTQTRSDGKSPAERRAGGEDNDDDSSSSDSDGGGFFEED